VEVSDSPALKELTPAQQSAKMRAMKSVEWVVLALFLALLWLKVRARRERTGISSAGKTVDGHRSDTKT
jgi:hypothetical protein